MGNQSFFHLTTEQNSLKRVEIQCWVQWRDGLTSNGWEVGGQGLISNTFLNQEFSKYSSEAIQRIMHLRRHRTFTRRKQMSAIWNLKKFHMVLKKWSIFKPKIKFPTYILATSFTNSSHVISFICKQKQNSYIPQIHVLPYKYKEKHS